VPGSVTPPGGPRRQRAVGHSVLVGAGILLSRIFGLLRQRALSHYLGLSAQADAFTQAFRIPNILQNLLGEGVLSASFIPVYARLRAEGKDDEAERVASAVFGLLAVVTAGLVLIGVVAAGPITTLIAPGFHDAKRDLTVRLVRLLFPGAGVLVLSAWCLGVLNSHRRFLLSYSAPVAWNLAIILTLVLTAGGKDEDAIALAAALGSVMGSVLQLAVQVPAVLGLVRQFRPTIDAASSHVRTVLANTGPVVLGRGVVQISAYVDSIIASLLGNGPVAALQNAQVLYTLPVSLFGMSVSAAELPAMSSTIGNLEEIAAQLRARLSSGLSRIAFFVIPSAAAFLALGDVIAAALFQTGRFTSSDSTFVWIILAGSAVGLLAATMGRLYSSAYYALRDTRSPLRFAAIRVALNTALGLFAALALPRLLGIDPKWGAAGLTAAAGIAAWVEYLLLERGLRARLGETGIGVARLARLWGAALVGAGLGVGVQGILPVVHPMWRAVAVLLPFGMGYLTLTHLLGIPEARAMVSRVRNVPPG